MKQNPSKTLAIQIILVAWSSLKLEGIWTSDIWYTFTSALDKVMDDVITSLHTGVHVVVFNPENIV